MKQKWISLLLVLAMAAGIMPGLAQTAEAAETDAVRGAGESPENEITIYFDNSVSNWRYVLAAYALTDGRVFEQGTPIGETSVYSFCPSRDVSEVYFTNYMPGMPAEYFPEGVQRTETFPVEANKTYAYTPDTAGGDAGDEAVQEMDPAVLQMIFAMLTKNRIPAVTVSEGGTVHADRSTVRYDQDVVYTITPDAGYAVADVIVDGRSVGAVTEYTFENVRKQHTLEVVFEKSIWVNPYSDIAETDRFYPDVAYVTEKGIMNGMEETGRFAPEESISRAMLVTVLWRMAGQPVVNYLMRFEDVPQGLWYSEAVRWAAAERIAVGYDGRFRPDDPITREELSVILYRYEQKLGGGFKGMWMFPLRFSDAADVSEWAYEAVCWLTMKGIYVTREDGRLAPGEEVSRSETAAFLHRYCEMKES